MASTSGSIAQTEFGPAAKPWQQTKQKIPLMQWIKITWKDGKQTQMLPYIPSDGASRDVLCGTDVSTNEEARVVVKIQEWKWHDEHVKLWEEADAKAEADAQANQQYSV